MTEAAQLVSNTHNPAVPKKKRKKASTPKAIAKRLAKAMIAQGLNLPTVASYITFAKSEGIKDVDNGIAGWAKGIVQDEYKRRDEEQKKKTIPSGPNRGTKLLAEKLAKTIIKQGLRPTSVIAVKGIAEDERFIGVTREVAASALEYVKREYKSIKDEWERDEEKEKEPTLATKITNMILDADILLFRDKVQLAHAKLKIDDHWEIWPVRGTRFKEFLIQTYRMATGSVPNSNAVNDARNALAAHAIQNGPFYPLHNRVAWHDSDIWVDMTNERWEVVHINKNGWEIRPDTPIPLFQRFDHQRPQVYPANSEDKSPESLKKKIMLLMKFHNLDNDKDQILDLAALVYSLVPDSPHPPTLCYGPAGSGKTLGFHRSTKLLVDPSSVTQGLSLPWKKGDLPLQLLRHYYMIYSNLSKLQDWQSDSLCRAVDGAADETRRLYKDTDVQSFQYTRCIGINAIPIVATREDLVDRSILVKLAAIPAEKRLDEEELKLSFEKVRPVLVGTMFDILAAAMRIKPTIKLGYIERMGSFTKWGCAIAEALGYSHEDFLDAYAANRKYANEEVVDSNVLSHVTMEFMEDKWSWEGAPRELYETLTELEFGKRTPHKEWPKDAVRMSKEYSRFEQPLKRSGLIVDRKGGTTRKIILTWRDGYGPKDAQTPLDISQGEKPETTVILSSTEKPQALEHTPDDPSKDNKKDDGMTVDDSNPLSSVRDNSIILEGGVGGERREEGRIEEKNKEGAGTKDRKIPSSSVIPSLPQKPLPRVMKRFEEWLSLLPNAGVRGFTEAEGLRVYGKEFHNRLYEYVEKHWLEQRGGTELWWPTKKWEDVLAAQAGGSQEERPEPRPKKAKKKKSKEAEDTKYSSGLKVHKHSLEYDSKLNVKEAKERRKIVKTALEYVQTLDSIVRIGKHDASLWTKWYREEIVLLDSIIKKKPKNSKTPKKAKGIPLLVESDEYTPIKNTQIRLAQAIIEQEQKLTSVRAIKAFAEAEGFGDVTKGVAGVAKAYVQRELTRRAAELKKKSSADKTEEVEWSDTRNNDKKRKEVISK